MNDVAVQKSVQELVRKKLHGRTTVKSKVQVHHKENVEREYKRVIDGLYAILLEALLPTITALLAGPMDVQDVPSEFRRDDRNSDVINFIRSAFRKISDDFHEKENLYGLRSKIEKLGDLTKKLSVKDWKNAVSRTLGINILDDYYSGEFYREQLRLWTDENASLIKSLPEDALSDMQSIVEEGFLGGKSSKDIIKAIQEHFDVSKSKARFYAVDQLAKLNAAITKQQQTEAGVEEYEWSTSRDQRVRDSHKKLDGKRFRWDDPPVVDEKTGRRAHPGEDYRCRCVALPIFNTETLNVPVSVDFKS